MAGTHGPWMVLDDPGLSRQPSGMILDRRGRCPGRFGMILNNGRNDPTPQPKIRPPIAAQRI
jgi:hypothetical protein